MKKVCDSIFMEVFLHSDFLLEFIFKPVEMLESDLKAELMNSLKIMEEYSAKCNLWNLSQFTYAIDPELQEWIDSEINKAELKIGITHEAFLVPTDLAAQLSVEQTMDEVHGQHLIIRYFSDRDYALKWLISEAAQS